MQWAEGCQPNAPKRPPAAAISSHRAPSTLSPPNSRFYPPAGFYPPVHIVACQHG